MTVISISIITTDNITTALLTWDLLENKGTRSGSDRCSLHPQSPPPGAGLLQRPSMAACPQDSRLPFIYILCIICYVYSM